MTADRTKALQLAGEVASAARPVWHVITNNGELHLHAPDRREAILCGLELLGPHAHLIRCSLLEQWA
jgi:hypothetical protein